MQHQTPATTRFTISETVERVVGSMVSLESANARLSSGVTSFDLRIRNSSGEAIFTPLRAGAAQLSSGSGKVTVANADNGAGGAGAAWDYAGRVGAHNLLTAGELSAARNLRFNNPNGESFTVTFSVTGHLARGSGGGDGGGGIPTNPASGGGDSSGTVTAPTLSGDVVSKVFRVTSTRCSTPRWLKRSAAQQDKQSQCRTGVSASFDKYHCPGMG